jgi:hypothetical protein
MARQKIEGGGERFVEVKDLNGNLVKIPAPEPLNVPQRDEQVGYVPEFVNVSGKIQLLTVPSDPDATVRVLRYGIVRGAQWRMMADEKTRVWGGHPPFIERQPKNGNGEFDPKYLLTTKQMISEVNALSDRRRISELIDHAIITGDDEFNGATNQKLAASRGREDRPEVSEVALRRRMDLEEIEERKREEQGLSGLA